MVRRKCLGIGQEAPGLCSAAIYTESMYFEHSRPANTGCEMLLSFAPGFKAGSVQVWVTFFGKEAIQILQSVRCRIEPPP